MFAFSKFSIPPFVAVSIGGKKLAYCLSETKRPEFIADPSSLPVLSSYFLTNNPARSGVELPLSLGVFMISP
jgi:hypothetical protein